MFAFREQYKKNMFTEIKMFIKQISFSEYGY
jgi:hypothetical protein